MDKLVVVKNKQVVVSSRQVAEHFGKLHKDVLETIRTKISSAENSAQWFYETYYKDKSGKKNPEFLMNRNGFAFIVMGFTGSKAAEWQVKYIEAFDEMEKELHSPKIVTKTVGGALKDVLIAKNTIKKLFPAVPEGIAMAKAFEQVENERNIDLSITKSLIPPDTTGDSECYLKPTDLAKKLNILYSTGRPNAQEVNKRLAEAGLQEKKNKEWNVTKKGMEYGKEFPYTNGSHSGYEIRWKKDVSNIIM